MSITRFMANKDHRPVTSTSSARISYFATPTELGEPLFDSTDMSRDNIRRHVRQERNSLSTDEQNQLALIASRHMLAEIQAQSAQHVALYFTQDGELSTKKLIEALWDLDINLYLPCIHPFSKGHLLFVRYDRDSVMVNNKYGISEPQLNVQHIITVNNLDLIITPVVAFDEHGNRMGMGSGYYDRTLAQVINNKPLAVGFAHDCQQVSQVPTDFWDIPLPVVITPTRRLAI
ncbi:5-formyltetrahydrofolate cyclo-ligase [Shewanella livingstonensis]|uniref:5-formyltetrahydrofolate cyclo-ligase n=1 Tax=Shewanella livingstonensis TaxID=150120 RepID=A0A3G8LSN2_9GAMM|nr:5-formyltetrahydrofolate cyclo-ligase [Shewanella livingstonensis]AZG72205.1 5-formyltetrahydrofolate cyclo-ligase [Shewanella livingstonensis]